MIVVDASAAIGLVAREEGHLGIASALLGHREAIAPAHIDVEVAGYLKRMERRGELDSERAARMLEDYGDLVGELTPPRTLLPVTWRLRHNFSIEDGFYVALAVLRRAPLLTRDRRLAAAARNHVEVLLV